MDVEHLRGNVAEGQIADDMLIVLELSHGCDAMGSPRDVVVADHDTLGVAGGAGCVDQSAALVGLELSNALVNLIVTLLATNLHKLVPRVDIISLGGSAVVLNDCAEVGKLAANLEDLLQLLVVLDDNNVSLAVGRHKRTRLGVVGRVDAGGETECEDRSNVSNEPFGRVEAQDANSVVGLETQLNHGLSGGAAVVIVLLVCPGLPNAVALDLHGLPLGGALKRSLEHIVDGDGRFSKRPGLSRAQLDLAIGIGSPNRRHSRTLRQKRNNFKKNYDREKQNSCKQWINLHCVAVIREREEELQGGSDRAH
eukprot:Opistho-2@21337